MPDRYFILRGLLLALLGFAFTIPNTSHATATVGLYSDINGFSCTFTGNDPGLVTAYLIVRPDEDGMRVVRVAAPVPECFGGVFIGDATPEGVLKLGDTQLGTALALTSCATEPTMMLTIYYQRNGSTTPCCDFSVKPDPVPDMIEITTCDLDTEPASPITSHMNADATCPCVDDVPPLPATNPLPVDMQTGVSDWPNLHWTGHDWNGDIVNYDVYFGTSPNPPLAGTVTVPPYEPPARLAPLTQHYWRVVTRDSKGTTSSSPVWRFTTGPSNRPPTVQLLAPADGATNIPVSSVSTLMWTGSDPDLQPVVFDLYFGKTNPPALLLTGLTTTTYSTVATPLEYLTDYYWKVIVRDGSHSETSSPVWTFKTRDGNSPPNPPTLPSPAQLAQNVPLGATLSATTTDPNGDPVTCDVYAGISSPPPLVAQDVPVGPGNITTFNPGGLAANQTYYWKFVVRDSKGATTPGPVWAFFTGNNNNPNPPSNPLPAQGATGQPTQLTLSWTGTDPDAGQTLRYDVYLGTTASPPLRNSDLPNPSVSVGLLGNLTYYWRVVAKDNFGGETSGPLWSFVTGQGGVNLPPTTPTNPFPANFGSTTDHNLALGWSSTDPEGLPLSFAIFFGLLPDPPFAGGSNTTSFSVSSLISGQRYYWYVIASDGVNQVRGPTWSFFFSSFVPVLFSHFDATVRGSVALVEWELQSDEAMASYTLYRREKNRSQPVAIHSAPVSDTKGEYLDRTVVEGKSYEYELLVRTTDGDEFRSQTAAVDMPVLELNLGRNHPNPFNPQTTIPYTVPNAGGLSRVRMTIYDASGRLVRTLVDEDQAGGSREVTWNGTDANNQGVTSGVYFCVLQVDKERRTQKMVLLK